MSDKSATELLRDYENESDPSVKALIYRRYREQVSRERVVRPIPDSDRPYRVPESTAAVG